MEEGRGGRRVKVGLRELEGRKRDKGGGSNGGGREGGWRVNKGGERERVSEGWGAEGGRVGEREGGWEPERSRVTS